MSSVLLLYLLLPLLQLCSARIFERCELAAQLQQQYGIPSAQVATLVCIAKHSSDLNTAAFGGGTGPGGGSHGIFQISDVYWCSPPGQGAGCGLSCSRLRDDDIADDVVCMRKIYAEHERISGDGFTAWQAYNTYCRQDVASYVAGCGQNNNAFNVAASYQVKRKQSYSQSQQQQQKIPVSYYQKQSQVGHHHQHQAQGKIYNRCELAQELYYKHKMPMQQIPTWVCIAQHESSYNTAAVGRLNADGSADHGLFQISDLFWCTHNQRAGKGCHATCNQFLDSSIADDVQCIKRIHQEHTQISGDGFNAWTVYNRDCRNQRYEQVSACFNKPPTTIIHPNAIGGAVGKVSYTYPVSRQPQGPTTPNPYYRVPVSKPSNYQAVGYEVNPFLRPKVQPHPNVIGVPTKTQYASSSYANPLLSFKQHTTPKLQQQHYYNKQQHQHYDTAPQRAGKVYKRCELAQELYFLHKFPMQDIATWVCIAEHESRLDTSAVGRLNVDGSADHGLFQISDLYWCTQDGSGGKGCHINCDRLLNSDISDDVQCIKTIHEEHTRISGDGFTAWTVYNGHCRERRSAEIESCFEKDELQKEPVKPVKAVKPAAKPKGKIYNRCELAQELYHKHMLPMREIPTWVCIAEHESSYNTAAVGRLNTDSSEDHGLFQISDLYWCSHDGSSGKACHIECDRLLDSDITDDVQCIRTIHEEHTRLSGDGFNAWTVYHGHCRHQSLAQLSDCFAGNEISLAQEHPQQSAPAPNKQNQPVPKIAVNHAFGSNPFLQRLSAPQSSQNAIPASKTTAKPPIEVPIVPNHSFASNPFLQHLKPLHQQMKPHQQSPLPPHKATNVYPLMSFDKISDLKPNYDLNPFLKPLNKHSEKVISHTAPIKLAQVKPAGNLFLSSDNKPKTATALRPTVSSKNTKHPYISSDSFRQEIAKLNATLSSTIAFNHITKPIPSTTPAPKTTKITTRLTTTYRPLTTARQFTTNRPYTTAKLTSRPTTTNSTSTTPRPISTTRRLTTFTQQAFKAYNTTLSRQTTTITTTRQTTTKPTILLTTTTRPVTRPITTRTTTPSKSIQTTTYATTRATLTTRSTTRSTTRPTTRPTTLQTTRSTTYFKVPPTTPSKSTIKTTYATTRATPTTRSTTRPTTHPTTLQTTRSTTYFKVPPTTPSKSTITTTYATTRATPTNRSTAKTTTRPTTFITALSPTRSTTYSKTPPTLSAKRPTTPLTTRPSTRSTTTWRPFTSTWLSTSFQTTSRSPTPTTGPPNIRTPTAYYKTTTRSPTTTTKYLPIAAKSTSTTPRPYLFTSTRSTATTKATTTTFRPSTSFKNSTTASPFDHPFFAKFKAFFKTNSTSAKPTTTTPTTLSSQSKFTGSPYYARFQENSAKVAAKTVFVYDFGHNRTAKTTTAIRPNSTAKTTTKSLDPHLKWNKN